MKNLLNISKIEEYFRGDLSESDMIDLEVRLLEDEDFRKEFQTMKVLVRGIKDSARKSTLGVKFDRLQNSRSLLRVLRSSKKGATVISLSNDRRKILYPMGIALLFAMFVLVLFRFPFSQNLGTEQMFVEYFEVSPNLDYRSARGTELDFDIARAYRAYDDENYALAAKLLEDLVVTGSDRLTHLFYLGNCYLMLEKWNHAITTLREPAYANFHLSDDAKWYLGLAYLRVEDINNAIPLLEETPRMLNRAKKSRKILRQLK